MERGSPIAHQIGTKACQLPQRDEPAIGLGIHAPRLEREVPGERPCIQTAGLGRVPLRPTELRCR